MQDKATESNIGGIARLLYMVFGVVALVVGLAGISFGSAWSPQVYELLFGFRAVELIDTFMPYFPLVPFYPIFILMLGAFLIVKSKA